MAETTRRLAAILSADIAGYSRLMAADEESTIRAVTARRQQVALLIEHHRGRLIDFVGDNFMAEFASAVDALECAMEIQQVGFALNASLPVDRRMEFRIGLHLGEVQAQDDRLFGTGVNIATRLEQVGDPGGVCISEDVHRQVAGRTPYSFRDLGSHEVKNLPGRIQAYAVVTGAAAENDAADRATATPSRRGLGLAMGAVLLVLVAGVGWWVWNEARPSGDGPRATLGTQADTGTGLPRKLVVLPFDDLSPAGDQGYLAQGVSDELVVELASTPGLQVKGRMTGASIKRAGLDVQQVSEQTGVTGIVDGSIRKSGERLRISVHVIAVSDGRNVWSQTYDRPLADIFSLQREIAAEVAAALQSGAPPRREAPTHSVEAYEHSIAADRLVGEFGPAAMAKALEHLDTAIEIDPNYALPHALRARAFAAQCELGYAPCEETLPRAEASLERALALDPAEPRAFDIQAELLAKRHRWDEAEAAARRATELDPESALGFTALARILLARGRIEEGFAAYDRALELDPLNPGILASAANSRSAVQEDHQRALELFELIDLVERDEKPPVRVIVQVVALARAGKLQEALGTLPQLELPPPVQSAITEAAEKNGPPGLYGGLLKVLVGSSGKPCTQSTTMGAVLRAMSGDVDGSIACLQEGVDKGSLLTPSSLYAHTWDPLRGDPRFEALLRKMKLEG